MFNNWRIENGTLELRISFLGLCSFRAKALLQSLCSSSFSLWFFNLQKAPVCACFVLCEPYLRRLRHEFLFSTQYLEIGAFYQKFTIEEICLVSNFLANHYIFIIICINFFVDCFRIFVLLAKFFCQCCGIVISVFVCWCSVYIAMLVFYCCSPIAVFRLWLF